MKIFKHFLVLALFASCAVSFTACGGPGEVKTVEEGERALPPAAQGVDPTDPNSGAGTSFE